MTVCMCVYMCIARSTPSCFITKMHAVQFTSCPLLFIIIFLSNYLLIKNKHAMFEGVISGVQEVNEVVQKMAGGDKPVPLWSEEGTSHVSQPSRLLFMLQLRLKVQYASVKWARLK